MSDLVFYINNVIAPPPDNWQELEVELDFTNNSNDATIRATVLEWKGANAAVLNQWFAGGLNNQYGIFEGIPFQIQACNGVVIFDGCIDTTSPETTWTCDIVKAAIKETQRAYFLNDLAQGFTFAYLQDAQSRNTGAAGFTPINPRTDYVSIPYIISNVPDYMQVLLLSVALVQLIQLVSSTTSSDLIKKFRDLVQKVADEWVMTAAAAIDRSFASAVKHAGLATFYTLQLAALILYIRSVILAIISLVISIQEALISPVRYKYGMKVLTLFQKACSYLGYQFSSSIIGPTGKYKDLILIPKKQAYSYNASGQDRALTSFNAVFSALGLGSLSSGRKNYDDEVNYPNVYGYYEGTFTQLIVDMEKVFNAKIAIKNVGGQNILYFERWDFFNNTAAYTLPDVSTEAPFDNPYGTNASEISSNYYLKWALDNSELNTYDIYDGTSCQMQLYANNIGNQKNNLLKNLTEIPLPFALTRRKINTSWFEYFLQAVFLIIRIPLQVLNALVFGPTLPNWTIQNRTGYMLLSCDFTSIPKLLIGQQKGSNDRNGIPIWIVSPNSNNGKGTSQIGYLDAFTLMKDFHSASWALDTLNGTSYPNQYLTYKDNEIPLCCSDFTLLKNNNIINTFDGRKGRLDSLRWNPHYQTAKVDYRIKQTYTKNLNQTFIVDGQ